MSDTGSEKHDSVVIEVSSVDASDNRKIKGSIQHFAGKRLTLVSDEEIAMGAAVRVQSRDLLFLGRVLESISDPPGKWTARVNVHRTFAVL